MKIDTNKLRKASGAIFIIIEEVVAQDISNMLNDAAAEIDRLRKQPVYLMTNGAYTRQVEKTLGRVCELTNKLVTFIRAISNQDNIPADIIESVAELNYYLAQVRPFTEEAQGEPEPNSLFNKEE
jgi:hypothetical protein